MFISKITKSHYLKFKSSGECISEDNPTKIINLEKDLYYSKALLFEKLSTDIVIALKEDLFYVLIKEASTCSYARTIKDRFKNLNDGSFISYKEVDAISRLFYYLITRL